MKEIKEILLLLKQGYFSLSPSAGSGEGSAGYAKMKEMMLKVEEGEINTDEDAAALFFMGDDTGSKYRKLKSELKGKLYEGVMNMNTHQSRFTDYQSAYYSCHKQWVVVKMLTGMNANTAAVALANRLLKQAEKYSFTLLCMDILSYLRIQYGVREANEKKYLAISVQFKIYFDILQAELTAEQYYTDLSVKLANNLAGKKEIHQLATQYSQEIEVHMRAKSSYKLQMYGYLIGLTRFSTVNDYLSSLAYSLEAVQYFRQLPYEAKIPLQIFNYQILVCNIQLRRFIEGEAVAKECIGLFEEGSFNWFKYQDLYFLLMLHTAEYEKAGALFRHILDHPKFEFLPESVKEIWRMYEAYIHYLTLFGEVSTAYTKKFRLSKFISDTSILIKDKGGRNVAVIIIRFLILLREEKLTMLLDEMETVHQYCYNYLRGENTRRSFALIKMLLAIPLVQYDPERTAAKIEKYQKVLNESPFDISNQTYEIEILPFEILWSLVMKGLTERKNKLSKKQGPK